MTRASGAAGGGARSLRALLAGVIDYAGLFPPASLTMQAAVAEYAGHAVGDDAPALGRFVVPAGRLEELAAAVAVVPMPNVWWPLSVLIGPSLKDDVDRVEAFQARGTRFAIIAVEAKAETPDEVLAVCRALPVARDRFIELPLGGDLGRLADAVRTSGAAAKIRTGGVTPGSFPTVADVMAFLRACRAARVAFKATAGLHHPVRAEHPVTYAPGSAVCTMYGFLNFLLASALAWQWADDEAVIAVLTERDANAFAFNDRQANVGATVITVGEIEAARLHFVRAIGSCSFREPMVGLAAMAAG
jgi:hypothetical protein